MLVADIYRTHPISIAEKTTVKEALSKLVHEHYNGLLVVDTNNVLVGILSLQDIAAAIVPPEMQENATLAEAMYKPNFFKEQCKAIENKPIKAVMRKDFIQVSPETSVMAVAADFLQHDLYIVPVVDKEELVGIVTRTEIKKALAAGMDILIDSNK